MTWVFQNLNYVYRLLYVLSLQICRGTNISHYFILKINISCLTLDIIGGSNVPLFYFRYTHEVTGLFELSITAQFIIEIGICCLFIYRISIVSSYSYIYLHL